MKISDDEIIERMLASCISAAYCKKSDFYPDKDYGGRIRESGENEKLLLSLARSALSNLDGVYVKGAKKEENTIRLSLLINDEARQVKINLENEI